MTAKFSCNKVVIVFNVLCRFDTLIFVVILASYFEENIVEKDSKIKDKFGTCYLPISFGLFTEEFSFSFSFAATMPRSLAYSFPYHTSNSSHSLISL